MPDLPAASDLAKNWTRARAKASPAREPSATVRAFGAIARGASDEALALCRADPTLLGVLDSGGSTLLNATLARADFDGAIALTALGALPSPERHVDGLSPERLLARALSLGARGARDLERASASISGSGRPAPSRLGWLLTAVELDQWSLAWDCARGWSLPPTPEARAAILPKLIAPAPLAGSSRQIETFRGALAEGVSSPRGWGAWSLAAWLAPLWAPDERAELWRSALDGGQLEVGDVLAAAGVEPPGWTMPPRDFHAQTSVLALSSSMGRPQWFEALRALPAAVEGARGFAHSPRELALCPVGDLAAMARLGIDIGTVDSHGHNFLHLWARSDNAPRPGWTTLGKLRPDLLAARGRSGQTPVDTQRSKLSDPARKSKFDALIADVERALVARAAPPSSAKPSAPKPRL